MADTRAEQRHDAPQDALTWSRITGFDADSPQWHEVKQVLATCGLLDTAADAYTLFALDDTRSEWKLRVCLLAGAHYGTDHGLDLAEATETVATLINDFYGEREDTTVEQMVARLRAEAPLRVLGIHHNPSGALRHLLGNANPGRRDKLAALVLDEATDDEALCVHVFDVLASNPQFWIKLARTCGGRWLAYHNNM